MASSPVSSSTRIVARTGAPLLWARTAGGPRRTFSAGSGDVPDLCGNYPAGARSGDCIYANSPSGRVLSFSGAGGALFPSAPPIAGPVSLSARVTLSAVPGNDYRVIFRLEMDSSHAIGLYLWGPDNVLAFYHIGDASGSINVNSATVPAVGPEYHVVGTFDGTDSRIYVNGAMEGFAAFAPPSLSTPAAYLGDYSGGGQRWSGTIADAQVYNYALSPGEISRLRARPDWRLKRCRGVSLDSEIGSGSGGSGGSGGSPTIAASYYQRRRSG
jgi:hypothetical protein